MSFSRGFERGQSIAKTLIDGYQQGKRRRETEAVTNAKPEDIEQYTPDQAESMRNIAETRDAQGNLVYQMEPMADGKGYGLKVRGETGDYAPVEGAGMAPAKQTQFLGKNYAKGELTPEREEAMRFRGLADVEAKYDPAAGLRMRREAGQMERQTKLDARQDKQFAREDATLAEQDATKAASKAFMESLLKNPDGTQRAPGPEDFTAFVAFQVRDAYGRGDMDAAVKGIERQAAYMNQQIDLQTKERTAAIGPAALAASQGDFEPIKQFYNKFVPDGANVTDVRMGKGGEVTVFRETDDGKPLPSTTIKGGINEVLAGLQTLSDPMAMFKYSSESFRNTLAANADHRADQQLGLDRERVGIARSAAADSRAARRTPQMFQDKTGKLVVMDMASLPIKDGQYVLPDGLRPITKALGPVERAAAIAKYVDAGFSPPQAALMVDEQTGMAPGSPSQADTSLQQLDKERGAAQKPAAPPAAPARQIGIIRPPRTAAEMRPAAPVSDDEFLTNTLAPAMRR
jgi:hypothetical protein